MPAKPEPKLLLQAARKRRGRPRTRLDNELRRVAKLDGHELPPRASLISMISRWENTGRMPDVYYHYLLRRVYEPTDGELGFRRLAGTRDSMVLSQYGNDDGGRLVRSGLVRDGPRSSSGVPAAGSP